MMDVVTCRTYPYQCIFIQVLHLLVIVSVYRYQPICHFADHVGAWCENLRKHVDCDVSVADVRQDLRGTMSLPTKR
jgi:hypothetical protein